MQKLFEEFPGTTAQQWKEQLAKDLKGIDFDALTWKTNNGFSVHPFYTPEDLKEKKTPLFSHHSWDICSEIIADDAKAANRVALHELNTGANALLFYLYPGIELKELLKDILIEHITVHFVFDFPAEDFINAFDALVKERKLDSAQLNGSVNIDPLENCIRTGNWKKDEATDLNELLRLSSPLRTFCINANCYHNAGATPAMELACALAHANEYIFLADPKNENAAALFRKFQFNLATGSDFFMEIAKLRALRKLWNLLLEQYNSASEIFIHCETSQVDKTSLDAYNNMLRTTTEAMSSVLGGCNSLSVRAFDNTFKNSGEFSSRIARNQQLILKEESYLDKVADVASGSYYIESLTDKLAEAAWEEFKKIESKGGLLACLKNEYIQATLEMQAEELMQEVKDAKRVLIGVNKFVNSNEKTEPDFTVQEYPVVKHAIRPLCAIRPGSIYEIKQ